MKPETRSCVVLCGLALTSTAWSAADEPDVELIEFLGSWVDETEDWEKFFDSIPQELVESELDGEQDGRSKERDSD